MRFEIPMGTDPVDPRYTALLAQLDRWSAALDSAYRIPWTPIRFGWDPIIGLMPVFGDLGTMAVSLYLVAMAHKLGAGTAMKLVMVANVVVDGLIGLIPIVGTVFDVLFRANERNLKLLVEEIERRRSSGP